MRAESRVYAVDFRMISALSDVVYIRYVESVRWAKYGRFPGVSRLASPISKKDCV